MRKRPGPDRIASILRDVQADLDAGLNINQACRKVGIGLTTYYRWKALQENPVSNEQLRVCELESEIGRLKHPRRRAGARPPHAPGGLEKKAMTAARRRQIVAELRDRFAVSQRRACRALGLNRSGVRYGPVPCDERVALARRIEELAGQHPRYGYRRIWAMLGREGWSVNKKAVHRLWRQAGLKLAGPRAAPKPRRPHGQDANACHLRPSRGKDDVWTWDFIFDRTSDGRSLKWLSLIDEYTRECLALEARRSMTAEEIREILAAVAAQRGGPAASDAERQRPGVRGRGGAVVAGGDGLRGALRGAGQSLAERLRGVVSQQAPRRVPGPRGVRERAASQGVGRALEGGVQYGTSAQFPGLPDTGRVRGHVREVCAYRRVPDWAIVY